MTCPGAEGGIDSIRAHRDPAAGSGAAACAAPSGEQAPVAHLREVLAAAAVSAGLVLREVEHPGVLTHAQARRAAARWGLIDSAADEAGSSRPGVVVVLVDGLGLEQLHERKGHAPTLRAWLSRQEAAGRSVRARTCLPSTTAAALTTLGTSALPGVTGMVGYSVLNPVIDRAAKVRGEPCADDNLSLIAWDGRAPDPRTWQDVPTVFERIEPAPARTASPGGVVAPKAVSIGPARFAGSGLTEAGLRGCRHRGADRMEDRPGIAAAELRSGARLVYLYVGELDHVGHVHGWRSAAWLRELERLDSALAELLRRVPAGTRVVLSADHGMIDTDPAHRLDLSEAPELTRGVVALAGEPRMSQLYVPGGAPELADRLARRWREVLGERALWVGTREQVPQLVGPLGERARSVVGDVVVAMAGRWVVVDPRVHSDAARAMEGVHGSLTEAETAIPLLIECT